MAPSLASALAAGTWKVAGGTDAQQKALLSQVSAALQSGQPVSLAVRAGPNSSGGATRILTTGTPFSTVTVTTVAAAPVTATTVTTPNTTTATIAPQPTIAVGTTTTTSVSETETLPIPDPNSSWTNFFLFHFSLNPFIHFHFYHFLNKHTVCDLISLVNRPCRLNHDCLLYVVSITAFFCRQ